MTTRQTMTDFSIVAILAREEPRTNTLHQQPSGTLFPRESCKELCTPSLYLERNQKFCSASNGPHLTEDSEPINISSLGRICDGTKVYYCPSCPYYSTKSGHMRYHLVAHTGVRPFKCDVCGKTFTQGSSLTTHRRIHAGVRPYKCNKCSYRSNYSSHLKTHISSKHTGKRMYTCIECSYKTASRSNFATHTRTHTGEKPYKCDLCQYRATQKQHLALHIARIHK